MSYVASVLRPHGVGLGISINSGCERESYASGAGPSCCPAYRNTPWAAVLTDMGTYSMSSTSEHCLKSGPVTECNKHCKNDTLNDPAVIQYCGGSEVLQASDSRLSFFAWRMMAHDEREEEEEGGGGRGRGNTLVLDCDSSAAVRLSRATSLTCCGARSPPYSSTGGRRYVSTITCLRPHIYCRYVSTITYLRPYICRSLLPSGLGIVGTMGLGQRMVSTRCSRFCSDAVQNDAWYNYDSGCFAGWTQSKLKTFLAFLDSVGIINVGIWCMADMPCPGIEPDYAGHNKTLEPNCPWMCKSFPSWRPHGLHIGWVCLRFVYAVHV